jgi:hypothetical protein
MNIRKAGNRLDDIAERSLVPRDRPPKPKARYIALNSSGVTFRRILAFPGESPRPGVVDVVVPRQDEYLDPEASTAPNQDASARWLAFSPLRVRSPLLARYPAYPSAVRSGMLPGFHG